MTDAERRRLGATFDSAADLYDRVRPDFPAEALDWVLPGDARQVLDLGAGTGKLTAALVERGLDVVAVDPSPNMLAQLRAKLPGVDARVGVAEHIELPDASVDAIVVGSAFHWFARPAADAEIARVLRPGGAVGLLWNLRDPSAVESRVFVEAQSGPAPPAGSATAGSSSTRAGSARHERGEFAHGQSLSPQELVDLVASRSYVIAMDEPERARLLERVRRVTREHPGLAGRETFRLPYTTIVLRARAH